MDDEVEYIFEDSDDGGPDEAFAEGAPDEEPSNGHRRGPGFLAGLFVGVAAGAVAALLSSPSEDEGNATGGLQARLKVAAEVGREAAKEKEAELRSRYDELTQ